MSLLFSRRMEIDMSLNLLVIYDEGGGYLGVYRGWYELCMCGAHTYCACTLRTNQ